MDSDRRHGGVRGLGPAQAVALGLVTALALALRWRSGLLHWHFIDLEVYRRGADALVHGRSLYAPTPLLPFTYPPFAAGVFVALYAVGLVVAAIAWSLLSLAGYGAVMTLVARHTGAARAVATAVLVAGLALEPVVRTLRLGQINLVLTALITVDLLGRHSRHRPAGLLTGVAAGIKVTPAVFLLYFLARRDWPAARRCVAAIALTVAAGAALAPHDSWHYWRHLGSEAASVGSTVYVDNTSISGVLGRALRTTTPPHAMTLALGLLALLLAYRAARLRLRVHGGEAGAMVSIAVGGLLASPISWTHHWVWLGPAVLVLLAESRLVQAAVTAVIGYLGLNWFTPQGADRELHDGPFAQLACASFLLLGVWFLLVAGPRITPSRHNASREQPGRERRHPARAA